MLPIALKSFHIKNYRGIIDTQIDNISPDTQWIFLTGENGFGKTSVLQFLASYLSSNYVNSTTYLNPKNNVQHIFHGKEYSKTKDGEFTLNANNDFENLRGENLVIAYGSTRLRISAGSANEVMDKYSSIDSLFSNEILLINIEENFKDWKINYPKGYEQLEKIFKTLIPRLGKIEVEVEEKTKRNKVKYYELDSENNLLEDNVELNDLAAGYKNILGMVGDMINRLTRESVPDDLSSLEGIVLIDEIDLHLHPKYQKLFVEKLTELFPKIQFIVSTHSPIPLLGAPKNSVIINVSRTREEGIKAELLDIDFSVLTPNSILSSPIFGFQDLIPESKSDDKMIRTEDTYKEVLFNDQLDKQISEYLTEDNQKELLYLLKENHL
ncbi:AAA ATPase-like protein [Arcicella aurantiaca]|uniref:AAA ATPase-like protein n=1 Tax=Arcicella aurantiaca TaxID=591202 RepID=A0A316E7G3_9BACT|nr:AAA family ATPase [Arcicella aurantiaca]PWK26384.1 AAA ATPase-like protein [Arcicella aurantiaca]